MNLITLLTFTNLALILCCSRIISKYRSSKLELSRAFKAIDKLYLKINEDKSIYHAQINSALGHFNKVIIESKISKNMASKAFDRAMDAVIKVNALEKSTHNIQFIPVEDKIKQNTKVENGLRKLFDPEDERAI
jgi:hypothetical protein